MRPFTTGSDHVNQIALETDEGSERIKAAYGANYERLVAVKNKYDPTNLFRHNQNIRRCRDHTQEQRFKYAAISFLVTPAELHPLALGVGRTRGCYRNSQRSALNGAKFRCASVHSVFGAG